MCIENTLLSDKSDKKLLKQAIAYSVWTGMGRKKKEEIIR